MKRPSALALCLLALLVLAACATPTRPSPPESSPRVRCLTDPRESGTRPLIFLFCIESP
ncbi:MAG TPA: hypothetical protein VGV13_12240 [Methylomirabilota bacterium]|jgi:hypothetical protein|nr:hypothetical protein [Methylomirabilota bacterium]